MKQVKFILPIFLFFYFNFYSFGTEPSEILLDTSLETRARQISSELRCLVCRNENIDSSNSGLAQDLRALVRERLSLGESDAEVLDFIHARYGDYILLRPRFSGNAIILWLIAPLSFLIGLLLIYLFLFKNNSANRSDNLMAPLSNSEKKVIRKLTKS